MINFSKQNSLITQFMTELRDRDIQRDSMRFRKNLERIGELMAYEISKELEYDAATVTTVLGEAKTFRLAAQPVLATILRAGLPFHQGFLSMFDQAENAFITAFRKEQKNKNEFEVEVNYMASPSVEGKTLILVDPMLATGSSMVLVYNELLKRGEPEQLHVVCAIASQQAVDYIQEYLPSNTKIWIGAVDAELNESGYITPGLGDAGNLAYGTKL